MSIFQLRDKWTTTVGDKEEFDSSCIWIGNIDNSNPPSEKVVVGSFQGFLRIFAPALRPYRVDDLLLEKNLQAAIYQVAGIGSGLPTVGGGEILNLGVLHSRKLSAYSVVVDKAGASLKLAYEISLKRNAFNFCIGKFGGASKDLICIQSVDGFLQFNDANSVLFSVVLPDFMLPGCLCYNSYTDSLAIATGALELEVYKYSSLGAFANSAQSGIKKLIPENTVIIGEPVLDLRYLRNPSKGGRGGELLILTLQHILVYDDSCFIVSQHRLDYTPTCMQPYSYFEKGSNRAFMGGASESLEKWLLLGSNTRHLLVYKGVATEWASQWTHVPIFVSTITVENTKGMIAVLSDEGHLSVTYLGTQPSGHLLALGQPKQISYEKVDAETARLRALIDKYEKEAPQRAMSEGAKGLLGVRMQVVGCGETNDYVEDPSNTLARGVNGGVIEASCRLILTVGATEERTLKNVSVNLVPPRGILIEQPYLSFPSVKAETPLVIPIFLRASNDTFPTSRKLSIYSSYQVTGTTASRVNYEEVELPLGLFAIPISSPKQLKDAPFKITLVVPKGAPALANLFEDFAKYDAQYGEIISANPGIVSFKYHNGFEFGVLLAKSGGKYRVQCRKFEGEMKCEDGLPIGEVHKLLDEHEEIKEKLKTQETELEQLSGLYRAIQKRLLLRFKDKNPAPLNNLDLLLNSTYQKIVGIANQTEHLQKELEGSCFKLFLALETLLLVLKIQCAMDMNTYNAIRESLAVEQVDEKWSQTAYRAAFVLIHTQLSPNKDKNVEIVIPKDKYDHKKFKKCISVICDRVLKGIRVAKEVDNK